MATIPTLRGTVDSAGLGRVLVHEHIFAMDIEYVLNYRPEALSDATVRAAAEKLNALKAAGYDTIIDLTVQGLGRHVPTLLRVAEHTEVNIIVSTGIYTFDQVPSAFEFHGPGLLFDSGETEPMVEHFLRDIREGIAGTDVRAGELKCAIDKPGLTPGVERVMRAVCRAHLETGVPITVHTAATAEMGLVAQSVMAEEGVDLADVIIGHCGDSTKLDYLMRLADMGSILGMDRFGVNFEITTAQRVATVAEMVKRGYADRMALSHDCACWSDRFPSPADYARVMPNHRLLHVPHDVVPALLEAGVSQADLDRMFIDNPRRHFEGAAARFAKR